MTLYETFFEMELSICERFPSLTPFQVRRERATEVFLLVRRLNNHTEKQSKQNTQLNKDDKKVIRRPAGDDWF